MALIETLRERVAQGGPMTFAEYMELALYHPTEGYYSAGPARIGPGGDFVTSSATHPAFGGLIARQMREMWDRLERPASFTVVEMGAGDGRLARDVLTWARRLSPRFYQRLRYVLVERSERQRERQRETLRRFWPGGHVVSVEDLAARQWEGLVGCFLSNELVDAFPVHRVFKEDGRLREVYVGMKDGQLVEVLGEPSTPAIEEHLRWLGVDVPEGNYAEVNLAAPKWMREVGGRLRRGFVVTIDYGYTTDELYAPSRHEGTLLGYRGHGYQKDVYQNVGQQDITAHVDFTSLIKAGGEAGLACAGLVTQREFLLRLGLAEYARALESVRLPAAETRANVRAMDELAHPQKLGRLKVLVQYKGVVAPRLRGLEGEGVDPFFERNAGRLPRLEWRRSRGFGQGWSAGGRQ